MQRRKIELKIAPPNETFLSQRSLSLSLSLSIVILYEHLFKSIIILYCGYMLLCPLCLKKKNGTYWYICRFCLCAATCVISASEKETQSGERESVQSNEWIKAWRHRMDYINDGARDIGRRKEVRFLSYTYKVFRSERTRMCARARGLVSLPRGRSFESGRARLES